MNESISNLRKLRLAKRLSGKEVASKLQINYQSYLLYERQINTPSIDVLRKLASFYNVSMAYLLGLEEESNLFDIELLYYDKLIHFNQNEKEKLLQKTIDEENKLKAKEKSHERSKIFENQRRIKSGERLFFHWDH